MKDNVLAAIDVGSSKVCTLVAEITPEEDLRILGVGITPSQGVKKGMVDNIQEATEAISELVERAERSSGSRILSAHVSIGGNHAQSMNNRGIATIPARSARSREDDIDRAMEGARVAQPADEPRDPAQHRALLRRRRPGPGDRPRRHVRQRLDVDAHIVTGSVTAIQNLTQCVEGAGVEVDAHRLRAARRRRGGAGGGREGAGRHPRRHRRRHHDIARLRRGRRLPHLACCRSAATT